MATQLTSAILGDGNIEVFIIKGDLSADESDVIVCTTTKNLSLSRGRVSKAILDSAGREMLKDCERKYPDGIQYNEIAAVCGGNLRCKEVYFIALPVWGSGPDEQKVLKTTIMGCLKQAHKSGHSCIAFPALGTGLLRYPTDMVAKTTFKCIEDFSNKYGMKTSVKIINVVIFHKDTEALQVYEREAMSRNGGTNGLGGAKPKMMKTIGVRSIITRQISNGNEDMSSIGNIEVQILSENYLESLADVIVNTIKPGSDLYDGDLTRSLLEHAGESLEEEFKKTNPHGVRQGEIAVTKGHNLKCKHIYHCSIQSWDKDKTAVAKSNLCKLICKCLKQAEKDQMNCIVFPPLGTGEFNFPVDIAADIMMKCIKRHQQNYSEQFPNDILIIVDESFKDWKAIKEIYEEKLHQSTSLDEITEDDSNSAMYLLLEMAAKSSMERNMLPPRGTKDWYRHLYKTMPRAPSYWSVYTKVKSLKDWLLESNNIPSRIPVDQATFMAIQKLVADTWEKKHVGQGRDASGLNSLNYSNIKVTKVERIENCGLYERYALKRQDLFQKAMRTGGFPSLMSLPNSSGKILTTECIPGDSVLNTDIYSEINEHYLFHGTLKDAAENIITQGLDCRLGGSHAMFGQGVYAAESCTKADQYADPKTHRTNDEKQMFLIRMCLGRMHLEQHARTFARAPCMRCQQDKCSCQNNEFFDSVVADGSWNFREFIVYDRTQVYPEYLISYVRV